MARENRFIIMLTERERQAIESLARAEKLPASTLARRRLLLEAEQRGMVSISEKHNGGAMDSEAQRATVAASTVSTIVH